MLVFGLRAAADKPTSLQRIKLSLLMDIETDGEHNERKPAMARLINRLIAAN
jgi:hypothetical protein